MEKKNNNTLNVDLESLSARCGVDGGGLHIVMVLSGGAALVILTEVDSNTGSGKVLT